MRNQHRRPFTSSDTAAKVSRPGDATVTRRQTADQHHQPADYDRRHGGAEPAGRYESNAAADPGPEVGPTRNGSGIDQLVGGEPASPCDHRRHSELGGCGDIPTLTADNEEVHRGNGVQRHEDRADQEQEGLVLAKVEQSSEQALPSPR